VLLAFLKKNLNLEVKEDTPNLNFFLKKSELRAKERYSVLSIPHLVSGTQDLWIPDNSISSQRQKNEKQILSPRAEVILNFSWKELTRKLLQS
jgi:hypothetical protein